MWSTLAYPFFRGFLYVFIVPLCVYILSKSLHQMAAMKKIKIYELRAIKVRFSCSHQAKQISIKSLFYMKFPLRSKWSFGAENHISMLYGIGGTRNDRKIETWLIFLMFSLVIITVGKITPAYFPETKARKNMIFHKINFNLKSVKLPE